MKRLALILTLLLGSVLPAWSQIILQQSTSRVISFGPFVSPTDGVTLQTGLVSALDNASTGIMLSKNGGAFAVRHATVTATTYDAYGNYLVTLDTTDTDTAGSLRVQFAAAASCLPVWRDFEVVPVSTYDRIVGGNNATVADIWSNSTRTLSSAANITSTGNAVGLGSDDEVLISVDETKLPAALVGGRMDSSVGAYQTGLTPLQPTVLGRTLDVTSTGGAGIDWANIKSPTTVVALSGTTVKDATDTLHSTVAARTLDVTATGGAGIDWGNVENQSTTVNLSGTTVLDATNPLHPTVAGRTLDVSTGGEAGLDWANIGSPTTTVNLSGTTVKNATDVLTDTANIKTRLPAALVSGRMDSQATTIGANAITNAALDPTADSEIAGAVWDEVLASHLGAGSAGAALNTAGAAADPWATALPGAYGAGTAGNIIGNNLNATVSSRASSSALSTVQSDTDDIQTRLPAALLSGRMDASVGAYQTGMVPLQPTVAGRTLDVTATGAGGVDWGNVENPTTTVGLTGTTISSSQVVGSITGVTFPTNFADLAISTGTGRVTVGTNNDKTGYSLSGTQTFNNTGNITGNLSGSVGSVTGGVGGNVTGSVGSISGITFPTNFGDLAVTSGTGRVTVGTNNDKTGYSLSSSQTFNVTGNITGNVTGSVGSVTGAVGSVTGNVGGNVVGSVGSISGVTFPTNFNLFSLDGSGHVVTTSGANTSIAQAIRDLTIEGSLTNGQLTRLMAATLLGKSSGSGTGTIVFRDANDTANRVTATVSGGNRTAVTLNP